VIWVVVRQGTEGILQGCPGIDRILTAAAPERAKRVLFNWWHDFRLIHEVRSWRFDYAFELTDGDRGRWICGLSHAPNRVANADTKLLPRWWHSRFNCLATCDWRNTHRVEKDFFTVNQFLPLGTGIPPLSFARDRAKVPALGQWPSQYAVIHPGSRWKRKRWPSQKWIALGQHLLTRLPQIVLSVGPDPEEVALANAIQAELGPGTLNTHGRLSWAEMAGLLYEARLFVGVDTAAMHLAAACRCPTVAIFGPSTPHEWRPWHVEHRVVQPKEDKLINLPDIERTRAVEVSEVVRACDELLSLGK
jgi:heptosyltransferase-3